ncbi:MAG: cysteine desulfurase-like protein [Anaerolineae bacterium]|jgi:cysteine desulfurase family protein (TIGR01976 family)
MDVTSLRAQFPALQQVDQNGRPYVYFDGPGGTQVPQSVTTAMGDYLVQANANTHGAFVTSRRTEETIAAAREAAADFLNAPSADEIVFGANMTTLTFHMSHAIGRLLKPGDEVIVTHLDHDANIAPWRRLETLGVEIHQVDFHPETCTLDLDELRRVLNPRTRLVAVGYASNAVGTINPVDRIAAWAHDVDAWVYVDAVHYAPHGPIDVTAIDCDFLVCSGYKFFGPHVGLLWGRQALLEQLPPDKVRPAPDQVPDRFETGTQNHEGLAGLTAAVDYLAGVGQQFGEPFVGWYGLLSGRRRHLKTGMAAIQAYEEKLVWRMIDGLRELPGLRIWGITDPALANQRAPTVSFTLEGFTPLEVARQLGEESIFVWDGNFYALAVTERLELEESGGLVRVGLAHYNTAEEVDRFLEAMERLVASR